MSRVAWEHGLDGDIFPEFLGSSCISQTSFCAQGNITMFPKDRDLLLMGPGGVNDGHI